jgi:hypothetical protein
VLIAATSAVALSAPKPGMLTSNRDWVWPETRPTA